MLVRELAYKESISCYRLDFFINRILDWIRNAVLSL